jgi:hypothetical protein
MLPSPPVPAAEEQPASPSPQQPLPSSQSQQASSKPRATSTTASAASSPLAGHTLTSYRHFFSPRRTRSSPQPIPVSGGVDAQQPQQQQQASLPYSLREHPLAEADDTRFEVSSTSIDDFFAPRTSSATKASGPLHEANMAQQPQQQQEHRGSDAGRRSQANSTASDSLQFSLSMPTRSAAGSSAGSSQLGTSAGDAIGGVGGKNDGRLSEEDFMAHSRFSVPSEEELTRQLRGMSRSSCTTNFGPTPAATTTAAASNASSYANNPLTTTSATPHHQRHFVFPSVTQQPSATRSDRLSRSAPGTRATTAPSSPAQLRRSESEREQSGSHSDLRSFDDRSFVVTPQHSASNLTRSKTPVGLKPLSYGSIAPSVAVSLFGGAIYG